MLQPKNNKTNQPLTGYNAQATAPSTKYFANLQATLAIFITPSQVVAWCTANNIVLPQMPGASVPTAQLLAKHSKQIMWFTSATNARLYPGWHLQNCVLSGTGNAFANSLKGAKFGGKRAVNHIVAKGMVAPSKNTGYWRHGPGPNTVTCGSYVHTAQVACMVPLTRVKRPKNTVAVLGANANAAALAGNQKLINIVGAMPPAFMLPPCSTWA